MFAFRDTLGPVGVAFTDRHGGVSEGEFASLNLSAGPGDDPHAVRENLARVVAELTIAAAERAEVDADRAEVDADRAEVAADRAEADDVPCTPSSREYDAASEVLTVVAMHQVHGSDVVVVDEDTVARPEVVVGDALVTTLPNVALLVRMADCVPVLLADPAAGVIGAVHAGRVGVVGGVVSAAVDACRRVGATQLVGWVGPAVCGGCYEVPAAMQSEVASRVPGTTARTRCGTPGLDLPAGVRAQLRSEGVRVLDAFRCTFEDESLFSYRRQGPRSGRLGGLVWRCP